MFSLIHLAKKVSPKHNENLLAKQVFQQTELASDFGDGTEEGLGFLISLLSPALTS